LAAVVKVNNGGLGRLATAPYKERRRLQGGFLFHGLNLKILGGRGASRPSRLRQHFWGALGGPVVRHYSIKKEERFNLLIFQDRFGQFLVALGQFRVFNGQIPVVFLVKL
jgi:hypothetical protein